MISQSTADCLKIQAGTRHIYRQYTSRYGRPRRYNNPIFPPSAVSDEDDASEPMETPEGIRVNTDLYDAYTPLQVELQFGTATHVDSTQEADRAFEALTSPRPRAASPSFLTTRRPIVGPSGSTLTRQPSVVGPALTRQPSIRRGLRTRTSDFIDFTTRRRSVGRQSQERTSESVRPEESTDGTWRFSSPQDRLDQEEGSSRHRPRRFFPLSAWSDPHLRLEVDDGAPEEVIHAPSETAFPPSSQSSSQLWYSLTAAASPPTAPSPPPPRISDGRVTAPRLRRGGVRAPESLLSRYASPSMEEALQLAGLSGTATEHATAAAPETQLGPPEDSAQLLTPRSNSPAGEN